MLLQANGSPAPNEAAREISFVQRTAKREEHAVSRKQKSGFPGLQCKRKSKSEPNFFLVFPCTRQPDH